MKTVEIYLDNFTKVGAPVMIEQLRYDKEVRLTGYKFKNHLWYSIVTDLMYVTDGSLYMTVDGKLLFSAIVENRKATVYLVRNGKRYEYRTFKVR